MAPCESHGPAVLDVPTTPVRPHLTPPQPVHFGWHVNITTLLMAQGGKSLVRGVCKIPGQSSTSCPDPDMGTKLLGQAARPDLVPFSSLFKKLVLSTFLTPGTLSPLCFLPSGPQGLCLFPQGPTT